MQKWLQQYEYHITLSWWIIAIASIITVVIALLTVSYQAVKAALAAYYIGAHCQAKY